MTKIYIVRVVQDADCAGHPEEFYVVEAPDEETALEVARKAKRELCRRSLNDDTDEFEFRIYSDYTPTGSPGFIQYIIVR